MKTTFILPALTLLFTLSFPALAQEDPVDRARAQAAAAQPDVADDPDNAKTPMNLLELLPKDEKDWPKPFWLVVEVGEKGDADDSFAMAWSLKRLGEDYVFEFMMANEQNKTASTLVYDAKGMLRSFDAVENRSYRDETITARVEGDKVHVKTVQTYKNDDPKEVRDPRTSEKTMDLSELTSGVPLEWLPLAVAYHAREGNLAFGFPVMIMQEGENELALKAEDIGGDTVEIDGAKRQARVYRVEVWDNDGDPQADREDAVTLFATFLTTGEFNSLSLKHEHLHAEAKRVSEAEFKKRLKAFEDAAGGE